MIEPPPKLPTGGNLSRWKVGLYSWLNDLLDYVVSIRPLDARIQTDHGFYGKSGGVGADGDDGKTVIRYCGVFMRGNTYYEGDFVSYYDMSGTMQLYECKTEYDISTLLEADEIGGGVSSSVYEALQPGRSDDDVNWKLITKDEMTERMKKMIVQPVLAIGLHSLFDANGKHLALDLRSKPICIDGEQKLFITPSTEDYIGP